MLRKFIVLEFKIPILTHVLMWFTSSFFGSVIDTAPAATKLLCSSPAVLESSNLGTFKVLLLEMPFWTPLINLSYSKNVFKNKKKK